MNPYLQADPDVVAAWIKGWTIARETRAPVKIKDGFRVDVDWPGQKARYVFPGITDEFRRLAAHIHDPWIFLKACVPRELMTFLPERWVIQAAGFMMSCSIPIPFKNVVLPDGYSIELQDRLPVPLVKIHSPDGDLAAIGRIALVDHFVIYDRIETHKDHRRRGLASLIMYNLQNIGQAYGAHKGILVATEQGKALYEALGWELHAHYTSAVIPGSEG